MSVLVYAESSEGKYKKAALEVVSYGKKVAEQIETNLVVLTINGQDTSELTNYGAFELFRPKNNCQHYKTSI